MNAFLYSVPQRLSSQDFHQSCPNNCVALLPASHIQKEIMFAVQSKEKSFLQNSRTFEKCMSWPGSKRKTDDTLLSVTLPALCQEQMLLSAGLVAGPIASHAPHIVSERSLLVDELPPMTAQGGPGRSSDDRRCAEPQCMAPGFPIKLADGSTATRY